MSIHLPKGVTFQELHAHLLRKRVAKLQEMEHLRQRGHELGMEIAELDDKIERCTEALTAEALKGASNG
jgi:hypothetical protein